jgi:hypothetical protein
MRVGYSKYNAKRTKVDGISFPSAGQARRYTELKLLAKLDKISNLELEPRYPLEVNGMRICTYVADFRYLENGTEVIEDFKGVITPLFKLKAKLLKAIYGIDIRLTYARSHTS